MIALLVIMPHALLRLIQLDDTRLVGVRGRDDYRFLRVDGQEYAAFTRPEYTMMIHQDSTHAVMVMAEAESGQLTAENHR